MRILLCFDWNTIGGGLWSLQTAYWLKNAYPSAEISLDPRSDDAVFPVLPWLAENFDILEYENLPDYQGDYVIANPLTGLYSPVTVRKRVDLSEPVFYLDNISKKSPDNMPHIEDMWFKDLKKHFSELKQIFDISVLAPEEAAVLGLKVKIQHQSFKNHLTDTIVINTNTRSPDERDIEFGIWGQIAEELMARNFHVIFTGYANQPPAEAELEMLVQNPRFTNWISSPGDEKLSVAELFVLLGNVKMVVSGDTGPPKIAAALGTPTLELYRESNFRVCAARGPYVEIMRGDLMHPELPDIRNAMETLLARSAARTGAIHPMLKL